MSKGSNSWRRLLLYTVIVDVGHSCWKPKLFLHSLLKPSLKPKPSSSFNHHKRFLSHAHSSSTTDSSSVATTDHSLQYLLNAEADVASLAKAVKGFRRIDEERVAMEKKLHDLYLDFRYSIVQMILENQMFTKDDIGSPSIASSKSTLPTTTASSSAPSRKIETAPRGSGSGSPMATNRNRQFRTVAITTPRQGLAKLTF